MRHNQPVTPETKATHIQQLETASQALATHDTARDALATALHNAIINASHDGMGPGEIARHVTYDRNHIGRIRQAAGITHRKP